jgi:hypothetical protein
VKRVFYDTSGDRSWAIPISQAASQLGASAPNPQNVNEGYDIGERIGDTGVSSPLMQAGLALVAGYEEGGANITINRRPNGNAMIMMVSPPADETRAAVIQRYGKENAF